MYISICICITQDLNPHISHCNFWKPNPSSLTPSECANQQNTQRSRNFGFVTFESADSVKVCVRVRWCVHACVFPRRWLGVSCFFGLFLLHKFLCTLMYQNVVWKLENTATLCKAHCNTLQRTNPGCGQGRRIHDSSEDTEHIATHTTIHCNILQHAATRKPRMWSRQENT